MEFNKEDIIWVIIVLFLIIVVATTDVKQNHYEEYS